MAVDLNLTQFVDLVVNDGGFREAISSGHKDTIKAALADPQRALTLSAVELDAAANALYDAKDKLGDMSALARALSHRLEDAAMN